MEYAIKVSYSMEACKHEIINSVLIAFYVDTLRLLMEHIIVEMKSVPVNLIYTIHQHSNFAIMFACNWTLVN